MCNTYANTVCNTGANTYAVGDNANDRETTFKITSRKLYVQFVTLLTKANVNLTKQLNEGFERPFYWNEYKSKEKQKLQIMTILQDFLLMLLFKELIDCLFLPLITPLKMLPIIQLTILLIEFKETVIENTSFQE